MSDWSWNWFSQAPAIFQGPLGSCVACDRAYAIALRAYIQGYPLRRLSSLYLYGQIYLGRSYRGACRESLMPMPQWYGVDTSSNTYQNAVAAASTAQPSAAAIADAANVVVMDQGGFSGTTADAQRALDAGYVLLAFMPPEHSVVVWGYDLSAGVWIGANSKSTGVAPARWAFGSIFPDWIVRDVEYKDAVRGPAPTPLPWPKFTGTIEVLSAPTQVSTGQPFDVVFRVTNTSSYTFPADGNPIADPPSYRVNVGVELPYWKPSVVHLPQDIPPSGSLDIPATLIAPTNADSYDFSWQLSRDLMFRFAGPPFGTFKLNVVATGSPLPPPPPPTTGNTQMLIDTIKSEANALVLGQITQAQIDALKADVAKLVPDAAVPAPAPTPVPTPTPSGTSVDGTTVPPAASIIDAKGGVWTLDTTKNKTTYGYPIMHDGKQATGGQGDLIVWIGGQIKARNAVNQWYVFIGGSWVPTSAPIL